MPIMKKRTQAKIKRLKKLSSNKKRYQQAVELRDEFQPMLHWLVKKYMPFLVPDSQQYDDAIASLDGHLWTMALSYDASFGAKPSTYFTPALQRFIWHYKHMQEKNGFTRAGKKACLNLQTASLDFVPENTKEPIVCTLASREGEVIPEHHEVREMLLKLRAGDQEILRLYYFEGYTLKELGEHLGKTGGRAEQLLKRAVANLAKLYGRYLHRA